MASKLPKPPPAAPVTNLKLPKAIREQSGVPKGPDGMRLPPPPAGPSRRVLVNPKTGTARVKLSAPVWIPADTPQRRFYEHAQEILGLSRPASNKAVGGTFERIGDFLGMPSSVRAEEGRLVGNMHPFSNRRIALEAGDMAAQRYTGAGVLQSEDATSALRSGPVNRAAATLKGALAQQRKMVRAAQRRKVLGLLGLAGIVSGAAAAVRRGD